MTDKAPVTVEQGDRFLLVKRGLYYRPGNQGYTGIKDRAGRYPESDASPEDGITAIHEDDAPEYSQACFADLKEKHMLGKIAALEEEIKRLREALTPSGSTKAAYHGEFAFNLHRIDDCGDEYVEKVYVPWDTVKQIMKAILARTALEGRGS
ncbi:hypothetical protein K7W03_25475 [Sphingobium sp. PNB]|uniref:hypothetical protein n=1 Tax=Sphingobium sp. PNB TaxID=863934 RepID=UPI001D00B8DF|nr:hypothetical protein [Sphingobium sp. PNB]MCB4862937.1 hypothetical protein [Sphingobium sp. PNB]